MKFLARQRLPIDLSLGGVRIYSDDALRVGELLKLEFFLEETEPVTYTAQVVWTEALSQDSPARFDVGLKFLDLEPAALKLLVGVLGPLEEEEAEGTGSEGQDESPGEPQSPQ